MKKTLTIEEKITDIRKNNNDKLRNELISEYIPFIITITSETLNRYIEIENDEEYLIALEAFNHSIDSYDRKKGRFLTYAKIIIRSRIIDSTRGKEIEIDNSFDLNTKKSTNDFEKEVSINDEIENFKNILDEYGISLDLLTEKTPKHKKTRCNSLYIARFVSKNSILRKFITSKKRLPITLISKSMNKSKRMIKYSKEYILSLVLVFIYNLEEMKEYINYLGGDCDE